MTLRVRVSDDFQVEVPAEARERLHIKQGDNLVVEVHEHAIVLVPEAPSYARRLRGLHREVWAGVNTDDYLRRERDSWGR